MKRYIQNQGVDLNALASLAELQAMAKMKPTMGERLLGAAGQVAGSYFDYKRAKDEREAQAAEAERERQAAAEEQRRKEQAEEQRFIVRENLKEITPEMQRQAYIKTLPQDQGREKTLAEMMTPERWKAVAPEIRERFVAMQGAELPEAVYTDIQGKRYYKEPEAEKKYARRTVVGADGWLYSIDPGAENLEPQRTNLYVGTKGGKARYIKAYKRDPKTGRNIEVGAFDTWTGRVINQQGQEIKSGMVDTEAEEVKKKFGVTGTYSE